MNTIKLKTRLSVYGKTKHIGEIYIRDILNKFYIVRSSWLYGIHGPNFITTMLNLAENNKEIKVVNDQGHLHTQLIYQKPLLKS